MTTTPLQSATGKTPSKRYQIIGFILTGIWILAVLGYSWFARGDFSQMEPNEFGDFFAGAFAPLAFLWLVLGFFQQGDELRHSAEALWLQGRELQHSVEAQRDLVKAAREQLSFDLERLESERKDIARSSQPVLELVATWNGVTSGGKTITQGFKLSNHGRPCTKIRLQFDGRTMVNAPLLDRGGSVDFQESFELDSDGQITSQIEYVDERGLTGTKRFSIRKKGMQFEISPVDAS